MCGIVGVIGHPLPARGQLERMRDALTHRGPDDAGLWSGDGAALGHRRLAVIDPGPGGHQPMVSPDGRFVLAYNGELYNDADLRDRLGGAWGTGCDTETLLRWLASGGAVASLRGMYAFALIDTRDRTLTLARDPLGVKPMFWARCPGGAVFASEPQALFAHPGLSPEPDPLGVSLYLSSLRTVMGRRTLFRGVRSLAPGEVLTFSLDAPEADPRSDCVEIVSSMPAPSDGEVRGEIEASVQAHLRSDVSLCAMLSGGLDSTIIASCAHRRVESLRTYCAGVDAPDGDITHAAAVARTFETQHTAAGLDEVTFASLWVDSIGRSGLPLATPNEVAIRLIAKTLRADGQVVTLSGEGADELFAGYDGPLTSAGARGEGSGGRFELESNAWVPGEIKPLLLTGALGASVSDQDALIALYEDEFARAGGDGGVESHLRFQRNVNLPMLLHRLDAATMLESVEGRTPFADCRVASLAASIPIDRLYDPAGGSPDTRTKLALRRAFAGRVPESVLKRDKASFPLPFEQWMQAGVRIACGSSAAVSVFQPAMLAAISDDPQRHWQAAWPVLNLAMWFERWWGDGLDQARAVSTLGTAASSRLV